MLMVEHLENFHCLCASQNYDIDASKYGSLPIHKFSYTEEIFVTYDTAEYDATNNIIWLEKPILWLFCECTDTDDFADFMIDMIITKYLDSHCRI